jgi:hypothetical protein
MNTKNILTQYQSIPLAILPVLSNISKKYGNNKICLVYLKICSIISNKVSITLIDQNDRILYFDIISENIPKGIYELGCILNSGCWYFILPSEFNYYKEVISNNELKLSMI